MKGAKSLTRLSNSPKVVRVLESVPPPGPIVKYVDSLVRHAPDDMKFTYFSWRHALFGRYDVFHVHWPEFLIRDKAGWRSALRRTLFRLFLFKLGLQSTAVVRTVHNAEPHHEGGEREAALLGRLDKYVKSYVVMSDCTPTPNPTLNTIIPHGHFIEPLSEFPPGARVGRRVLLFGRIEPYKGVMDLISAAEQIALDGVEIRIVGSAKPEMTQRIVKEVEKQDRTGARISLDLRTVSDAEMVTEMTEADLIALPYTDAGNGNSGVALVALSLNRPVLVYRNCIMERLADDCGPGWVQLMDGHIAAEHIEAALRNTSHLGDGDSPVLTGRDWHSVAASYAEVFRQVQRRN